MRNESRLHDAAFGRRADEEDAIAGPGQQPAHDVAAGSVRSLPISPGASLSHRSRSSLT